MKIVNCLGKDFDNACFNLSTKIVSNDYRPDIIIGIAKGGDIVGSKIYEYLKVDNFIRYYTVKIQHPCTIFMKNFGIKKLFKIMPKRSLNLLRKIILYIREFNWTYFSHNIKRIGEVKLPDNVIKYISEHNYCKILIIDDAIDSGKTISLVYDYIKSINRYSIVKCGVLNTTFRKPCFTPHYCLYDRIILRFPWAFDAFRFENKEEL